MIICRVMKISAIVITFNEEDNISDALDSIKWADEIIVVDSQSTDRTVEIASRFTGKVIIRPWPGYSAQKNFAQEQAAHDWIFSLDADERVSDELAREIESIKREPDASVSGYEMPRLTNYLGRWIKHSGWYPDYKLRLYDRRKGAWRGDYVHESIRVDGAVERLKGELLHYTVKSVSDHHLRIDRYTTLAAKQARSEGKRASFASLVFTPVATFIRSYILKLGFLDGFEGLIIARFAAYYAFLKNLKLRELEKAERKKETRKQGS